MQQERRVGRSPRDRPVHVVDREIAHARPARWLRPARGLRACRRRLRRAGWSARTARCSFRTCGPRLRRSDRCAHTKHAPSSNAGPSAAEHAPAFLAVLSTERQRSIAGSTFASRARTGSRRYKRRREISARCASSVGRRAHQRLCVRPLRSRGRRLRPRSQNSAIIACRAAHGRRSSPATEIAPSGGDQIGNRRGDRLAAMREFECARHRAAPGAGRRGLA